MGVARVAGESNKMTAEISWRPHGGVGDAMRPANLSPCARQINVLGLVFSDPVKRRPHRDSTIRRGPFPRDGIGGGRRDAKKKPATGAGFYENKKVASLRQG